MALTFAFRAAVGVAGILWFLKYSPIWGEDEYDFHTPFSLFYDLARVIVNYVIYTLSKITALRRWTRLLILVCIKVFLKVLKQSEVWVNVFCNNKHFLANMSSNLCRNLEGDYWDILLKLCGPKICMSHYCNSGSNIVFDFLKRVF